MVIDYVDTQAEIKNLDRKRKAGTTGFLKNKRDKKEGDFTATARRMDSSSDICYKCGKPRHFARECKATVECTKCKSDRHCTEMNRDE